MTARPPEVRRERLGAWLMRRSPDSIDLDTLTTRELVGDWCVRPSYRVALMEPGDRVLMWLSGRHPDYPRGLWASGRLTTPAAERVGLRLQPLFPPVTDELLRRRGIDDLEVQRQPMGSNPSWVSDQQWARIADLLG